MSDMAQIIGTTFVDDTEEFIYEARSSDVELLELRIDAVKDYDIDDLFESDKRFVITIRHKDEGGIKKISEEERLNIFEEFLTIEPSFLDIELESEILDQVLDRIEGTSTRAIISHHNFEKTPDINRLNRLYEKIEMKDPSLIKIVTFCNTLKDNFKILKFLMDRSNLISFCMGKEGIISRIFSLKYCPLTYGSLSGSDTAPGQLSVEELKQLKEMLADE